MSPTGVAVLGDMAVSGVVSQGLGQYAPPTMNDAKATPEGAPTPSGGTHRPPGDGPGEAAELGLWAEIRGGIAGKRRNYTQGSISRAVIVLAVPMMLEMSMQSVFAVVDIFFVGKLGPDAVAAVGITESVLTLIFAIAMGLSMGTTAMVARRIGEGEDDRAAVATVQSLVLGSAIAIGLGFVGWILAPRLMALMGASGEMIEVGTGYARIIFATNITVVLLFLINAAFRGAGDAALAMRSLWLANIANIVLDPMLIFGLGPIPALGLEGAAIATATGRALGVAYQLRYLLRGTGRLALTRRHLRFESDMAWRLLRVSANGMVQFLVGTASWLGIFRILAGFGSAALAGYTIAVRIVIFAILPSWGVGNAAASLVGQNLGAGQPDRAERSVYTAAAGNMVFMVLVALVFQFFSRPIVGWFSDQPEVIDIAVECLQIVTLAYVFMGFGMVCVQAFNGAGNTSTPTWINFFCYWLFQLPTAWFLSHSWGWGPRGVFIAIALSQVALAVVGFLLFRRGHWKSQVI